MRPYVKTGRPVGRPRSADPRTTRIRLILNNQEFQALSRLTDVFHASLADSVRSAALQVAAEAAPTSPRQTEQPTTARLREVGSALRAVRRQYGLTQAQLAHTLGMWHDQVSRIERGVCSTSSASLLWIPRLVAVLRLVKRPAK